MASSTHADVLVPEGLDVTLVAAPMARPGRGLIRARALRALETEVGVLRGNGTRTIVLIPNDDVLAAAEGFPRSQPGANIVEAARQQTITAFKDMQSGR